jgi:hypothetical protein
MTSAMQSFNPLFISVPSDLMGQKKSCFAVFRSCYDFGTMEGQQERNSMPIALIADSLRRPPLPKLVVFIPKSADTGKYDGTVFDLMDGWSQIVGFTLIFKRWGKPLPIFYGEKPNRRRLKSDPDEFHAAWKLAMSAGADGIMMWDIDYLMQRKDYLQRIQQLKQHGKHLVTFDGCSINTIANGIDAVLDPQIAFATARKERSKRLGSHMFQTGRRSDGVPPYGFMAAYNEGVDGKQVRSIIPNKQEQQLLDRVVELYNAGNGAITIAKTLNQEGWRKRSEGARRPKRSWVSTEIDKLVMKILTWQEFDRDQNGLENLDTNRRPVIQPSAGNPWYPLDWTQARAEAQRAKRTDRQSNDQAG